MLLGWDEMSIQEVKSYVGVNVASKHLDLFDASTGKAERVKNDTDSIEMVHQSRRRCNVNF